MEALAVDALKNTKKTQFFFYFFPILKMEALAVDALKNTKKLHFVDTGSGCYERKIKLKKKHRYVSNSDFFHFLHME
ncbi:hypothetical protein BpHYR1_005599 [Brachionus plicatilis]|uniref:Uncharacterized protein n=1 Tax=Brachionus plicatilis TaxID=10195 RepID=A0A3M7P5M0_BRAPC|nr:hypothetical protein BpHYR1_005599 [Brachionus plicatilis]